MTRLDKCSLPGSMLPAAAVLLGSLLLAACAHAPQSPSGSSAPAPQAAEPQVEAANNQDEAAPTEPVEQAEVPQSLPNIPLNSELLFEFVLSEIASQRGEDALAVESSMSLAKKTRDPRLAMRAAHLTLQSGQIDKALEALKIWRNADPSSIMARRMLSSVLLRSGNIQEATVEFTDLLKVDEKHASQNFLQIFQMLSSYPDRAAALKLLSTLAQPYPRVAEARWGVAQLAQASGDQELALKEVRQARSLRPDWDRAASLEALLLQKSAPQQGLELLRNYLSGHPAAAEVRLQYARALLDQKQYQEARAEFQQLAEANPDNPELAYAIALISLQMKDLVNAEIQLKEALNKGKKEQDTAQYYLGQLSEAKKNDVDALAYYREVKGGEYLVPAQIRIAYLLSKHGQLAEARRLLHEVHAPSDLPRAQLAMVEAQLLREANQDSEAYQVLQQALAKQPNQVELMYEAAMMAERLGKYDEFEQAMRKLIKAKPDYAQAYNALGYSMLERNERIPEAVQLVEKALQLSPDDIAIMDSVGWAYYLSGRLDESVKLLRRAFAGDANPEIAAHLGEVLWVRGDKEEAKKIWQDSLKDNAGNKPLQAVIQKYDP